MSQDLYFGFKVGEKRYSYRPADDVAFAAFINLALYGQTEFPRVTVADVKLHNELSERQGAAEDDATYDAISRVLYASPVSRFAGSQGSAWRILEGAGLDVDLDDGRLDDPDEIITVFRALGLREEAAGMIDHIYWG
jgi:hypothetical protein